MRNVLGLLALTFMLPVHAAEAYPAKAIRIVVPSVAGGALDSTVRLIAPKLAEKLGGTVIVDNRPGAGGALGIRLVKDAPADGYTLLAQTNSLTALPAMNANPGYDVVRDFSPIGTILQAPNIMAVGAAQPFRNVNELISAARTKNLSYATAGLGSPLHLNGALFAEKRGLSLLHVPYKGSALAYPDVASGVVTMTFGGYAGIAPYLQSGKMRALAVTSPMRLPALPDVPTLGEQGVALNYSFWVGLLAPAGTPDAVVRTLSDALRGVLRMEEVRSRFHNDGALTWETTPADFSTYLAKEVVEIEDLARKLKIVKE